MNTGITILLPQGRRQSGPSRVLTGAVTLNHSFADPLRKEVSIVTVAFRPRSQAAQGPAPPGAPQKEHPQPRARPMRATCCAAPHAPRGGRTPSLCRSRGAGRPGLPSPDDKPDMPLCPRAPGTPARTLRAPAGERHLPRRNLRARPALPAPARALSNPPSAGPAPGPCGPPPPATAAALAPPPLPRAPPQQLWAPNP